MHGNFSIAMLVFGGCPVRTISIRKDLVHRPIDYQSFMPMDGCFRLQIDILWVNFVKNHSVG